MSGAAPHPARAPPARVTLEGRYCRLQPIGPQHAEGLWAATAGEGEDRRYRWLFEAPPLSLDHLRLWLTDAARRDDPLHFAVVDRTSGFAAGRQALMRIEPAHGVVEIGSILWGKGVAGTRLATEAFYLHAAYVFEELGNRRFEWKCNARNEPSRRAAARFGFTFEGVFRQHMIVKAASRDTAWFSMLDSEWPDRKSSFEAWLDPANFDDDGVQRRPLARAGSR